MKYLLFELLKVLAFALLMTCELGGVGGVMSYTGAGLQAVAEDDIHSGVE